MTPEPVTPEPVLAVEGLRVSAATDHGRVTVVDDVSLALRPGRIHGLAGESGSGKTVTGLAVLGLLARPALRVEAGTARLGGDDLLALGERELRAIRGRRVSMVFQEPMTSLDPAFTVGRTIGEVLRTHLRLSRRAARARAVELLDRVGIPEPDRRVDAYPFELSGGMLQRVLIATAIACEPAVLLADEPTTALDVTVQAGILALLRSLADDGMAVLLVTHDLGLLAEHCDDLTVMYAGQVVESGPVADVLTAPAHPYTAGLLAAVPSATVRADRLAAIPGAVPAPHLMPTGCRFADRCPHRRAECAEPVPLTGGAGRARRCVRADDLVLEGV
ncbi:ABC transporter ATP-binding protein [Actinomadura atramentaria]|uniref:ABC transporter ATP-binding protein n=1 Tax=Actinomadura atramentaria TaxID=1990 RepID=UPI0003A2D60C|nr:ABC transporter ATP-binding protein [Actinomadura atramentaria]